MCSCLDTDVTQTKYTSGLPVLFLHTTSGQRQAVGMHQNNAIVVMVTAHTGSDLQECGTIMRVCNDIDSDVHCPGQGSNRIH